MVRNVRHRANVRDSAEALGHLFACKVHGEGRSYGRERATPAIIGATGSPANSSLPAGCLSEV
jgi:hypothetical protein